MTVLPNNTLEKRLTSFPFVFLLLLSILTGIIYTSSIIIKIVVVIVVGIVAVVVVVMSNNTDSGSSSSSSGHVFESFLNCSNNTTSTTSSNNDVSSFQSYVQLPSSDSIDTNPTRTCYVCGWGDTVSKDDDDDNDDTIRRLHDYHTLCHLKNELKNEYTKATSTISTTAKKEMILLKATRSSLINKIDSITSRIDDSNATLAAHRVNKLRYW